MCSSNITIRADGYVFVIEKLIQQEFYSSVEPLHHLADECTMEVALERSLASETEI
jgi:hypothetical protein